MWTKKLLAVTIVFLLIALVGSSVASAGESSSGFKVVPAKDVELVKKATIKDLPARAGGAKKPKTGAATGILGEGLSGDRYAIVIGISDYPGTTSDLEYCDDDALSMRDVLVEVYDFPLDNVITLIDGNATATSIYDAVNTIENLESADDEVVFFFSGHGAKGVGDDGDSERVDESIVCWDDDGDFAYIWDGQLKSWFADFETSRIVFIFDSCLSGGMTDLSALFRVINMASTESGYSYEFDSLGHGEFTYWFVVQGMENAQADIYDHDRNGALSESSDVVVEEAFDYAKANCRYSRPTISDGFSNDLLP